ncbi:hypothetical protein N7495_005873 [Penicillium taxi]|uniref:uncharacterized protein n=1 Tax=Penicillium taxi TaxID=168475 RepID=UPI00254596E7|nr:uncharacterized protein N7495_005873 [Penicillium taxi]KAJ5894182.1 hypothetical protein N7495_005873 [Penicillium taxi]
MAVRRSARLRSTSAQPSPAPDVRTQATPVLNPLSRRHCMYVQESISQPAISAKLSSVEERDETTAHDAHTPVSKKSVQKTPKTTKHQKITETRTPTSASAPRPPRQEMHPSKARQSTTKQPDSGLLLGFNPVKKDADGKIVKETIIDTTPSKSRASPGLTQYGTPGYEIKFGQDAQLSEEARLLMASVREDVSRIKAQMISDKAQKDEQEHAAESAYGTRKIAKPRGKAGRFSDVHMAEFKKMDSIAGHPSSFRATPGRLLPTEKSLKRTKSKAQLDEPDEKSSSSHSPAQPGATSTPTASGKRVKHNLTDDTSTNRTSIKKEEIDIKKTIGKPAGPRAPPAVPRARAIRSSLMTPTRASMSRSTASVRAPKTSLIPSKVRSPAVNVAAPPRTPRTDFNPRFKSSLPTFNALRSILRKRQPLFSRDPSKIAAGTHLAAPDFNPDSIFSAKPETESAPTPSPKKHVEFTPSVKSRYTLAQEAQESPSQSKIPTTPSRSNTSNISYPTLPTLTPEKNAAVEASPSIRHVRRSDASSPASSHSELPVVTHGIAHGILNKKRHRDQVDDYDVHTTENAENKSPAVGRTPKRLKKCPPTPSPVKTQPIKTPVRSMPGRVATPASQKPRGMLRMSRLNMLSKPKARN